MGVRRPFGAVLVAVVMAVGLLSGCGLSAEEKVAVQEAQLEEFVAQADEWGAEIIAQIPEEEAEDVYPNMGGVAKVSDYGVEWPKCYYWDQIVVLRADGPRSPTQVADDLVPWLEEQGWERNTDGEFPPGKASFERDYYRDGFHLTLEVYTVPPPHAQKVMFTIVTPHTDADRR